MSNVYESKRLFLDKIMGDAEAAKLLGTFVKSGDCKHIIKNRSIDVYDKTNHKLIVSIRKGAIPKEHRDNAYDSICASAMKNKTNSRGVASGKLNFDKLPPGVVEIVEPDKFKSQVVYDDGYVTNYKISNKVNSMICGYYNYPFGKGKDETAFTRSNPTLWHNFKQTIVYLDYLFRYLYDSKWQKQNEQIGSSPYRIEDTVFSTVTVNLNFQTAIHLDKGDLKDGYSIFFLCKEGKWEGGYLCYPQYGVAIEVEERDFVIMNPHEYHGNSEFMVNGLHEAIPDHEMIKRDYRRLSFVLYFRQGLL